MYLSSQSQDLGKSKARNAASSLRRALASLGLAAKPQSGSSGMKTAATTLYFFLFNVSFPLDYKLHEDKDILYLLHCLSPVLKASLEQPRH